MKKYGYYKKDDYLKIWEYKEFNYLLSSIFLIENKNYNSLTLLLIHYRNGKLSKSNKIIFRILVDLIKMIFVYWWYKKDFPSHWKSFLFILKTQIVFQKMVFISFLQILNI
jgi:hypothetical protein